MGCSHEGCDCWGLVRLIYKEEFGIDIPPATIDMIDHASMGLIPTCLDSMWDKTDNPAPGDVINFRVLGHDMHVGIVTSPGYMLHVFDEGHTSCIEPYTSRRWKKRIAGIYSYAHTEKLIPTGTDGVYVIGKPHPLKPRVTAVITAGKSLEDIIMQMCDEMNVPEYVRNQGAACINLMYVPRDRWATTFPKHGDTVIFRLRGVAGGGGLFGSIGSILGIAAIVAAAALTWWAGGTGAAVVGGWLGVSSTIAGGLMAVTSLGLTVAGMALLNNSIAAKPAAMSGGTADVGSFVDSKFLGGGNNSLRTYESIPQVLGIGRMTFDYLGKPYTEQADQYTNYLRVIFTAGYGPVQIEDIRNGDTPITSYNEIQHNIHVGWGGDQTPELYTQDASETNVSVTLGKHQHNYRITDDEVDQIQVVLYWPQGLWYRNNRGEKCNITSTGIIRFREVGKRAKDGTGWKPIHSTIRGATLRLASCLPLEDYKTEYHEDTPSEYWNERYGTPKYTYATRKSYTLYRWYTISVQQSTGNIRSYPGCLTDQQYEQPTQEFVDLVRKGSFTGWGYSGSTTEEPRIAGVPFGEILIGHVCVSGNRIIEVIDERGAVVSGAEFTVSEDTEFPELIVAPGTVNLDAASPELRRTLRNTSGSNTWHVTKNDELRAFTQVYTFDVPRGKYEIDVELTSADDEEKAGWDAQAAVQVQWLVMRTFTFRKPFTARKSLAWFEMRIRATDQINGNLNEINGMVSSIVLDYDYTTDSWVERISNNPASLFRHVLQGPAMADEYRVDDRHIDIKKLQDWHNYCRVQGFTYFKVVGADSTLSVYELLTEIASAGYAKPVLRPEEGGIWSVWVDEPQTSVMQHFTEHNTWGVKWTKNTISIPHAIRATFVNKDKGYEQDTVTVYVDGHDESTATRFENWDTNYFKGVTDIKQVQRICRRSLAFAKLRPESLSFMCAMEYVTSQVGDLVRVTNSFVQWGLGSGWITEVFKNEDGDAIGLRLSDSVTKTRGGMFSIRVRKAAEKGTSFKMSIAASDVDEQVYEVYFPSPVSEGYPEVGDLYQYGFFDRESHECLITSIVPEAGDVARITVCDYSPEIYDIDDGPLPDYDAGISQPPKLPGSSITAQPVVVEVISDESVLVVGADGSLTPRIAVVWARPEYCESSVSHIQFRYRVSANGIPSGDPSDTGVSEEGATTEAGSWSITGTTPIDDTTVFLYPVMELYRYDVEARFVTSMGVTGQWKRMCSNYAVIGRTTPPPPPDMVYLEGYIVRIQQSNRPVDVVGHEIWIGYDADDPFSYAKKVSSPYVTDGQFDVTPYAGNARQIFVRTIDVVGLTSNPVRVVIDYGDEPIGNVVFSISERDDNKWSGTIVGGYLLFNSLFSNSTAKLWPVPEVVEDEDGVTRELTEPSELPIWNHTYMWPVGVAEQMSYTWRMYVPVSFKDTRVSVLPEYESGKVLSIEMRSVLVPALWGLDGSKLWEHNGKNPLWIDVQLAEWKLFPNNYKTNGGEIIEFRLTMSPGEAARVIDIVTVFDVPDKEWVLSDIEVPVEGVYVEIPEKFFRAVTNVTFGMQYREDLNATTIQRIKEQNPPTDDEGYLVRGPLIKGFDAEYNPARANVDIRMKGY